MKLLDACYPNMFIAKLIILEGIRRTSTFVPHDIAARPEATRQPIQRKPSSRLGQYGESRMGLLRAGSSQRDTAQWTLLRYPCV